MFLRQIIRITLTIMALVVPSLVVPANAQRPANAPVIVVIPEVFPAAPTIPGRIAQSDISALVRRYATSTGRQDVIILNRENPTPAVLNAALFALTRHRAARPNLEHNSVMTIPAAIHLPHPNPRIGAALAAKLAEMRNQQLSNRPDVGMARWVEITDLSQYQ